MASWRQRLARIKAAAPPDAPRARVLFMEWADPIYCSGHWVPEMIELAGGMDLLGRVGRGPADAYRRCAAAQELEEPVSPAG